MSVSEADLSAYEEDSKAGIDDTNILARITLKARELREAKDEVDAGQEALKLSQDRERKIREHDLPELMREAGQEKLRTSDGFELELEEKLYASIPKANLEAAVEWLEEQGQSAIVKRDLLLKFGKNEDTKANEALQIILEGGFTPQDKQSVHPQTLAATIRELIANGSDVPLELLGAYYRSGVKMKEAKK